MYYQEHGLLSARPVVVLHGGPGGGIQHSVLDFFGPKWRVILYDQRGCGRSTPSLSLRHNTTWDLVADLERMLRSYLEVFVSSPLGAVVLSPVRRRARREPHHVIELHQHVLAKPRIRAEEDGSGIGHGDAILEGACAHRARGEGGVERVHSTEERAGRGGEDCGCRGGSRR